MENQPIFKTGFVLYVSFLMSACILGIVSCNNHNAANDGMSNVDSTSVTSTDTTTHPMVSDNSAAPTPTGPVNKDDSTFIMAAAMINYHEIAFAGLAQENTKNQDVLDLAKMMVEEHNTSLRELRDLATKKGVSIPEPGPNDKMDGYSKLRKEMGKMFDKDYTSAMVKGHTDAIAKFESEISTAADPDVKAWATATLPVLKTHLQHSEDCQKKVMTPM